MISQAIKPRFFPLGPWTSYEIYKFLLNLKQQHMESQANPIKSITDWAEVRLKTKGSHSHNMLTDLKLEVPEVGLIWSSGFSCNSIVFFLSFLVFVLLLDLPEQGIQPMFLYTLLFLSAKPKTQRESRRPLSTAQRLKDKQSTLPNSQITQKQKPNTGSKLIARACGPL